MMRNNFKQAEEGGLLGGGAPPASTAPSLTPSGIPANASNPPVEVPPAQAPQTTNFAATDWRSALPQEIKETGWIKNFDSPEALAKSYANSLKMVGADKIVVPNQYATDEDWKQVWGKLGLPESPDKYEIKLKEGADYDQEFLKSFKAAAHASGVLPKQAQKVMEWFDGEAEKLLQKSTQASEAAAKAKAEELQKEWGQAYDMKLKAAQAAVNKFGDEGFKKHLADSGLAHDPQMIKLFAKIGESFSEDSFKGQGERSSGFFTPEAALKEANKIVNDMKHAYHDKKNPGHNDAVVEVNKLFKMAYSSKT